MSTMVPGQGYPLGYFQTVSTCWCPPKRQLLTCMREKVSLSLVVCRNARLGQLGPALSDSASGDPPWTVIVPATFPRGCLVSVSGWPL